jgi:hypothetical protein
MASPAPELIAIDLGRGFGLRCEVHDAGNGLLAAFDPTRGQYLGIVPTTGEHQWAESIGEYEAFSLQGNVVSFYSVNNNPDKLVWLFGCSTLIKGVAE